MDPFCRACALLRSPSDSTLLCYGVQTLVSDRSLGKGANPKFLDGTARDLTDLACIRFLKVASSSSSRASGSGDTSPTDCNIME
jgi:hypothetical protein